MKYSLWSRDRLLGETDFGYPRDTSRWRIGDLAPTALGMQLLPVVASVNQILLEAGRDGRRGRKAGVLSEDAEVELFRTALADMKEASTHMEALELELRGPDGRVIPTESIDINDADFLAEFGREIEEQEPELIEYAESAGVALEPGTAGGLPDPTCADECSLPEPDGFWSDYDAEGGMIEEPPFPRFQIMVQLLDDAAIP